MAAVAMSPPLEADMKVDIKVEDEAKPALTPPTSEASNKKDDDSGSELSDLEPEETTETAEPAKTPAPEPKREDDGEIRPDHYYEGGNVPVFKPTMDQFRSFKDFVSKIDKYGMKSGIVKVIPPKEWRDKLPSLDEQIKTIKVKNPITQEFHGTHGTYTQANIEKQRSYNLPQWKALSEESNHQPPAKRGERRRNQEKPARNAATRNKNAPAATGAGKKKGPGCSKSKTLTAIQKKEAEGGDDTDDSKVQVPPTPTSPALKSSKSRKEQLTDDDEAKTKGRQPKSVSARRQHNRRDQAEAVDEEAFKTFDYRIYNQDEWTKERCQELETSYWKSLTFNNPLYGADMPGSLFDDTTEEWNVAKLENLLDVLGQKVPGVNTAYLYLGMWKASFAWHLEDVDLYSINYIHFGAPKQWYSISQADARRFEAAMRNVWPSDAKNCDQFLRHKTYLISPQLLQSQYNIRVNRLVHNEGEFVITFPYGYHSGYNLGYNCAESVNFATESWLEYGRIAKKCNCEADSVWVDVRDIERKLRGEPTPEYYEETDDDEDEDDEDGPTDLPTPPGSDKGKPKRSHKRKRDPNEKDSKPKIKRLRIKIKAPSYEPCTLCPNDDKYEKLLPTDNGRKAHRRCGLYTPETYIFEQDGAEMVCNVARIDKARLELRCVFCRNKRGAVFQCSQKKCTRAYHATCAAQAGVQVDIGDIPVFAEDGTEYIDTGIDFRCRFHRVKRGKNLDSAALEENVFSRKQALKMSVGEVVQAQYYQGDIFAGVVLENRKSEQTLLLEMLPKGDHVEVEYKWLLVFDPLNSLRPIPSENAKPMPLEMARTTRTTAEAPTNNDNPKINDPFCDPNGLFKWSEFDTCKPFHNSAQVKIDFDKPGKIWHYLGKTSTEAKAQYTHDLTVQQHNQKSSFLESVRLASLSVAAQPIRRSYPASFPSGINQNAINAARASGPVQHFKKQAPPQSKQQMTKERPYHGKYAITDPVPSYQYNQRNGVNVDPQALRNQRDFQQTASRQPLQQYRPQHSYNNSFSSNRAPPAPMSSIAPTAPMMSGTSQQPSPEQHHGPENFNYNYNYNRYPPLHQPAPSNHANSRPQAPVANMMRGSPHVRQTSTTASIFSAPTASSPTARSDQTKPSVSTASSIIKEEAREIKRVSHLNVSAKYTYLHDAEKSRPQVYQSPYALGGGFTTPYLPVPFAAQKTRPRGASISEDYLMKQTASLREEVANKINEDKARFQQQRHQQIQRRQSINQSNPPQSSSPQYHQPQPQRPHTQPQHFPMSAIHSNPSNPHAHGNPSYYNPTASDYQSFDNFSSYTHNSFNQPESPQYPSQQPFQPNQTRQTQPFYTPPYPSQPTGGLQFQSPQDFQQAIQRDTTSSLQEAGFDRFWQGLQTAAGQNNGHGHDNASISGTGAGAGAGTGGQGSPLKYEMAGGGGEMLPMMREGARF